MITSLARQLTQQLCDAGVLAPEHSELYEYGFFLILSRIIFGIITLLTGIVLGVAFESMTFYCMFLLIRGYGRRSTRSQRVNMYGLYHSNNVLSGYRDIFAEAGRYILFRLGCPTNQCSNDYYYCPGRI